MKYLYIEPTNSVLTQILDETDPTFPGIPMERRYSAEYLGRCVILPEDAAAGLHTGMMYDPDTGPSPSPRSRQSRKLSRISALHRPRRKAPRNCCWRWRQTMKKDFACWRWG